MFGGEFSLITGHSYVGLRRLGHGSFGEVHLGRVLETGQLVALKRIYLRSCQEGLPENVVREMKSMLSVDHPNVVKLHDVCAKEYCMADLGSLLKNCMFRVPIPIVKAIMQQLLQGVAACHHAALMHRDLKPSNVLVSHTGYVKLADFGLARLQQPGSQRPEYTHTVATRWYRAPELLYGARKYSQAVDMWAVGAIMAEILGLGPLIAGENDIDQLGRMIQVLGSIEVAWPQVSELPDWGKISFPPAPGQALGDLLPDAPEGALQLLQQMLRYDPEQRPTAVQALQDEWLFADPPPASRAQLAAFTRATLEAAAPPGAAAADDSAPSEEGC